MIEWLNANQGFALTLLTLIYVVANIIIVVIMTRANKLTAESINTAIQLDRERTRPSILFHLDTGLSGFVEASLKNIGATTAFDIMVSVAPKLNTSVGGHIIVDFAEEPVASLPPGASISTLIGVFHKIEDEYPELVYKGDVQYVDATGKHFTEPFKIDLSIHKHLQHLARNDIHDVAIQLEKIHRTLDGISSGFRKPLVRVLDEHAYQEDQRKAASERQKRAAEHKKSTMEEKAGQESGKEAP